MFPVPGATPAVAQDAQPTAAKDNDPPAARLKKYRRNIAMLSKEKAARCRKALRKLSKTDIRLHAHKPKKSKEFTKSRRREAFEARLNAKGPSPLRRALDPKADAPHVRVVRVRLRLPKAPSTPASDAVTASQPTMASRPASTHPSSTVSPPLEQLGASGVSGKDAQAAPASDDAAPDVEEESPRMVLVEGDESHEDPLRAALWASFWLSVEAAAGVPREQLDTWDKILDVICTARQSERAIALRLFNRPPAGDADLVLASAGLPRAMSFAPDDERMPLEPLNGRKRSRGKEDEEAEARPAKRTATKDLKQALSTPGSRLAKSGIQVGRHVHDPNHIVPPSDSHAPSEGPKGWQRAGSWSALDGDSMEFAPRFRSGDNGEATASAN